MNRSLTITKEVEVEVEIDYDYSITSSGVEVSVEDDSFTIPMEAIIDELDDEDKKQVVASMGLNLLIETMTDMVDQQEKNHNNLRARINDLLRTNASLSDEIRRLRIMLSPAPEAVEALGNANKETPQ
jgi:uncharacterized protein with von Willebrand factor type A (vWA) domain